MRHNGGWDGMASGRRQVSSSSGKSLAPSARQSELPSKGHGANETPGRNGYDRYTGIRSLLNPMWCYHGFRLAVLALTSFGVIMVFSSSSVSLIAAGVSPWKQAISQGLYCLIGLILGVVACYVPSNMYHRFAVFFLGFALFLQLLTLTPLRVEVNGNAGWIGIPGGFTMQPAEVTKLALCIWLPAALETSRRMYRRRGIRAYLLAAGMFVVSLLLVVLGKDIGTAMIVVLIGVAAFLVGGVPMRWLLGVFLVVAGGIGAFVVSSPNRMERIFAAYQECSTVDAMQVCYQSIHARYAMASGGLLGVGIGNSREKWNYLPEAHNDFIFAIIGEETGFIGAAVVIVLFVVLGWCMICIALQSRDRFVGTVLVCITVWLTGQGLINIMVVIGLLPVMGVPMPFVSAGGSSLIMCLIAAGVAVSMMRADPHIHAGTSALSS